MSKLINAKVFDRLVYLKKDEDGFVAKKGSWVVLQGHEQKRTVAFIRIIQSDAPFPEHNSYRLICGFEMLTLDPTLMQLKFDSEEQALQHLKNVIEGLSLKQLSFLICQN